VLVVRLHGKRRELGRRLRLLQQRVRGDLRPETRLAARTQLLRGRRRRGLFRALVLHVAQQERAQSLGGLRRVGFAHRRAFGNQLSLRLCLGEVDRTLRRPPPPGWSESVRVNQRRWKNNRCG
jgi:hypothetical protein